MSYLISGEGVSLLGQLLGKHLVWITLEAHCASVDPELFFLHSSENRSEQAKKVCNDCPLIDPCRAHALSNPLEVGVWGGLSEVDRRKVRGRRKKAA